MAENVVLQSIPSPHMNSNGSSSIEEDTYIVSNFNSICRLCLGRDGVMSHIFDHTPRSAEDSPLFAKIQEFIEVQIYPDDGLPSRICHRCLYKTEKYIKFRAKCSASDTKLRRLTRKLPKAETANGLDIKSDIPYVLEESVVTIVDPNMEYDDASEKSENEQPEVEVDNSEVNGDSFNKRVAMCRFCDKAFVEEDACLEHERKDHDPAAPYECSDCGQTFALRTGQVLHLRNVHNNLRPYLCSQCKKSFRNRSDLRKHCVVHTGVRPYQCMFCLKSFSRNTNLSKHLRIHYGQKPHVCPQCPMSFISKGDLSRHVMVHSGAKPYACSVCPLSFGRRDKLLKHEARHAKIEESPKYEKEENIVVALDPFNSENANLEEDVILKQEEEEYPDLEPESDSDDSTNGATKDIECQQCPKKFSSMVSFNKHLACHDWVKSFQCTVCHKIFMRRCDLDRHANVHSGLRPFECTRCDKKFGRKDKLVRHERIHDDKKEFDCGQCSATFTRKDSLTTHYKTHLKDDNMPYGILDDDMEYDD